MGRFSNYSQQQLADVVEDLHDIVLGNTHTGTPSLRKDFYEHKRLYDDLQKAAELVQAKAAGRSQIAGIAWAVVKYFLTPTGIVAAGYTIWSYITGVWTP